MTLLLPEAEDLLTTSGYQVKRDPASMGSLAFEDGTLYGLLVEYESLEDLKSRWKDEERKFLFQHSSSLRQAAQKAWNCYSIHLTAEVPDDSDRRHLLLIEENFSSTRKVARAGITSHVDLTRALTPILPIQNPNSLRQTPLVPGIRERLPDWPTSAVDALLGDATVDSTVELLLSEGE